MQFEHIPAEVIFHNIFPNLKDVDVAKLLRVSKMMHHLAVDTMHARFDHFCARMAILPLPMLVDILIEKDKMLKHIPNKKCIHLWNICAAKFADQTLSSVTKGMAIYKLFSTPNFTLQHFFTESVLRHFCVGELKTIAANVPLSAACGQFRFKFNLTREQATNFDFIFMTMLQIVHKFETRKSQFYNECAFCSKKIHAETIFIHFQMQYFHKWCFVNKMG